MRIVLHISSGRAMARNSAEDAERALARGGEEEAGVADGGEGADIADGGREADVADGGRGGEEGVDFADDELEEEAEGDGAADVGGIGGIAAGAGDVGGAGGGVWAAAAALGDAAAGRRAELVQQQKDLKAQRRRLTMDLANENRKRVRLLEKAKGLSDADLMAILASRAAAKAKAKPKATPKAKAKAKGKR